MNRREFFTRTAGVAVGAAIAPHVKVAPAVAVTPLAVPFPSQQFLKYAKVLGEAARRQQEMALLSVFDTSPS